MARMVNLFYGVVKRNQPVKLGDPHPLINYGDDQHSGDAGKDGYSVLSRASPTYQGDPPMVEGATGRDYLGPDGSFEQ